MWECLFNRDVGNDDEENVNDNDNNVQLVRDQFTKLPHVYEEHPARRKFPAFFLFLNHITHEIWRNKNTLYSLNMNQ